MGVGQKIVRQNFVRHRPLSNNRAIPTNEVIDSVRRSNPLFPKV